MEVLKYQNLCQLLNFDIMDKKKNTTTEAERDYASKNYPGVAVNEADNEKDDVRLQKERTCILGNNPRNQK